MDDRRLSKAMSLVLRHDPDKAGLTLDPQGWAPLDALVAGLRRMKLRATADDVRRIITENDKQRFRLSDDGLRVRASQGHSVTVALGYEATDPPGILYHGTAERTLPTIRAEGLRPMRRQHVHLSADTETARRTGARHGRPVVLTIDTGAMMAAGHAFFRADNSVWLTGAVPPAFLSGFDGGD